MAAPRAQMPSSLPEGHAKRNRKKSRAQLGYEETERAMANQFSQSSVDAGALEISSDEEFNARHAKRPARQLNRTEDQSKRRNSSSRNHAAQTSSFENSERLSQAAQAPNLPAPVPAESGENERVGPELDTLELDLDKDGSDHYAEDDVDDESGDENLPESQSEEVTASALPPISASVTGPGAYEAGPNIGVPAPIPGPVQSPASGLQFAGGTHVQVTKSSYSPHQLFHMLRLRTAQHFTAYLGGADMKALLDGVLPRLDLTNKEDMDLYTDSKKRAKDWIRSWKSQLSGHSRRFFAHWLETNPEYENCYRFDDLKAALIRTYQEHWPGQVFRSTMRFIDSESITPRGKKWLKFATIQVLIRVRLADLQRKHKGNPELAKYDRQNFLSRFDTLKVDTPFFKNVGFRDFPIGQNIGLALNPSTTTDRPIDLDDPDLGIDGYFSS